MNTFGILHGVKYFSSRIFQNYLGLIAAKKFFKYFSGILGLIFENLMECQQKIMKI